MSEALDWRAALFARRTMGVRPGTAALEQVLDVLCPGLRARPPFVVTQIVGTNGKGSTAAMLAHGLQQAGAGPVGLYTSPHLHRVGERIRVDGRAVADDEVRRGVAEVAAAEAEAGVPLSFFEVLTAIAMARFVAAGCRHVILEAGLGGRLDATSAMPAALTLIARIGLDHQGFLGETIAAIAQEKAAVIRPGVPVFSVIQREEARRVIEDRARQQGAPLTVVAPSERPPAGLIGAHQQSNAGLALAGLAALLSGREGSAAADPSLIDGVRWPGRLEWIGPLCFDVAHNLDGVEALTAALDAQDPDRAPAAIVFGTVADKPSAAIAAALRRYAPLWHVPLQHGAPGEPGPGPALGPGERRFAGPDDPALLAAIAQARDAGARLLICGSHFLVGPLRAWALGLDPREIDDPGLSDPVPR